MKLANIFIYIRVILLTLCEQKASFSLPLLINMVVHHQIFDVSIIFCSLTITHWWYISIFPLIVNRPHLFSKTSSVCREQTSIPERFLRRWWQENLRWLKRECCETLVPIRDQNAKMLYRRWMVASAKK